MANDESHKNHKGTGEDGASGPILSEIVKRLVAAGVTAAFMTEESIRSYVGELKLPKDVLGMLLQGAAKSKEEIANRVSREIINIISKIDFVKEASRFVEEHKFKIHAEVEVIKKNSPSSL
jgi:hypothetical protein